MKRVPQMRNCVSTICTNCRVFPTGGRFHYQPKICSIPPTWKIPPVDSPTKISHSLSTRGGGFPLHPLFALKEITCIRASYGRFQFEMGSSFMWCRKKSCEINLTWIPGSYCQNWIGYYHWVRKPKYRWHCLKVKRDVHKTQKLWESIGETESKQLEKSEKSRETEDNVGLGWNFGF